ncbi:MAG TPA: hypothetical protein VFU23_11510, partial [Gemmatimonadales bacterium]|nr:hypothetical protein [Gemmatimonadales bacterium]
VLLWLSCAFWVGRMEAVEMPPSADALLNPPPPRPRAELWMLSVAPSALMFLLPIGFGGAWLVHAARSAALREAARF